jgi:hypothetical protein
MPRLHRAALAVAAALLAAGCARDDRAAAGGDSLLSRDLTLAGAATPPDYSALGDTAANTPAPATAPDRTPASAPVPTPTPAPTRTPRPTPQPVEAPAPMQAAAPAPATAPATAPDSTPAAAASGMRRAIAAGTALSATTRADICSQANGPGDRLVATLSADVTGPDGARLPAGTPVLLEMATPPAGADFAFRPIAVQVDGVLLPVEGAVAADGVASERRVAQGNDKAKVIGGAIAGAVIGKVLGGGTRGAVIGAAGGAAAGTIAANRSATSERCLAAGAVVTVTLSAPLVLATRAP